MGIWKKITGIEKIEKMREKAEQEQREAEQRRDPLQQEHHGKESQRLDDRTTGSGHTDLFHSGYLNRSGDSAVAGEFENGRIAFGSVGNCA